MVLLGNGETILLQDVAQLDGVGRGTLVLTNSRLIFEVTTGLLSKKTDIRYYCRLTNLGDARVEGLVGKRIAVQSINDTTGKLSKETFAVSNPASWEKSIKGAMHGS